MSATDWLLDTLRRFSEHSPPRTSLHGIPAEAFLADSIISAALALDLRYAFSLTTNVLSVYKLSPIHRAFISMLDYSFQDAKSSGVLTEEEWQEVTTQPLESFLSPPRDCGHQEKGEGCVLRRDTVLRVPDWNLAGKGEEFPRMVALVGFEEDEGIQLKLQAEDWLLNSSGRVQLVMAVDIKEHKAGKAVRTARAPDPLHEEDVVTEEWVGPIVHATLEFYERGGDDRSICGVPELPKYNFFAPQCSRPEIPVRYLLPKAEVTGARRVPLDVGVGKRGINKACRELAVIRWRTKMLNIQQQNQHQTQQIPG